MLDDKINGAAKIERLKNPSDRSEFPDQLKQVSRAQDRDECGAQYPRQSFWSSHANASHRPDPILGLVVADKKLADLEYRLQ